MVGAHIIGFAAEQGGGEKVKKKGTVTMLVMDSLYELLH
jgi:hypothetical protein